MVHVSGITGAGPIWHDFMVWALKNRPPASFSRPDGLIEAQVCALSGQLPSRNCPHRRQELFIAGTEPTETCDIHQLLRIDESTGLQATEATPSERVRERVYAVYPAEAQAWAIGHGVPQPPPAPEPSLGEPEPGTEPGERGPLEIVSPFQMDRYRISPSLPLKDQRILIKARPGGQVAFALVTIYVDDEPLASFSQPPYRLWWPLEVGEHQILAVGETPQGEQIVSEVIVVLVGG
jgi:membrane carboxypeptidase/penicillin-binding protein PbpC